MSAVIRPTLSPRNVVALELRTPKFRKRVVTLKTRYNRKRLGKVEV